MENEDAKRILKKIIEQTDSELKGFCRIKHKKGWLHFLEDGQIPFTPKKLHETLWSIIDTKEYRPRGKKLFDRRRDSHSIKPLRCPDVSQ